jgi:hypothetical protein
MTTPVMRYTVHQHWQMYVRKCTYSQMREKYSLQLGLLQKGTDISSRMAQNMAAKFAHHRND